MKKSGKATMRDVAKAAGVSYQTVSRVINNSPDVANATRERVRQAIKDLDYQPNQAARLLRNVQSYVIEFIVFSEKNPTPSMLGPMLKHAKTLGYILLLRHVTDSDELIDLIRTSCSRPVDAIAIFAQQPLKGRLRLPTDCDVPLLQLHSQLSDVCSLLAYDQEKGIRAILGHLIELGHTHIAEISGRLEPIHFDAQKRHKAFLNSIKANNLPIAPSVSIPAFSSENGYVAMQTLLERRDEFTAVCCQTDQVALGAMKAIYDAGLRVPDDISVTGYDDRFDAAYYTPALTTVRQDMLVLGKMALDMLVARIETPTLPVSVRILTPDLIVRESTRVVNPVNDSQ